VLDLAKAKCWGCEFYDVVVVDCLLLCEDTTTKFDKNIFHSSHNFCLLFHVGEVATK
jgi:hypothetical protein